MNEKIWFVILNDSHIGPFTDKEIIKKLSKGEIQTSTLIWRVGLDSPQRFDQLFAPEMQDTSSEFSSPIVSKTKNSKNIYAALITFVVFLIWFFNPKVEMGSAKLQLTKDYQAIVLSKKFPLDCSVVMEARSVPDETIGEGQIQFFAKTKIINQEATFNTFEFVTGSRILPGFYHVRMNYYDCTRSSVRSAFKVSAKDEIEVQVNVLLFEGDESTFNEHLISYKKEKVETQQIQKTEDAKAEEDIIEDAETLKALSFQIEENFNLLFNKKISWKNRVVEMTKSYTLKYGSFLNGFVTLAKINPGVSPAMKLKVEEMLLKAKRLGFISMKLIEEAQGSDKEIVDFKNKITSEFLSYRSELDQELDSSNHDE